MADAEKNAMFYNNGSGSPVADMYVDDEKMLATTGLIEEMGSGTVKRDLKQRHIAMIALGGTIGTGLFIGLGTSLSGAGPLSTLLGYSIMGCLVWALMIAMGEMAAYLPVAGGFIHHTSRFVDPSLGSALAWLYWFSYGITLPTEISAGALVVSYWDPDQHINPAVWITLLMIVCVGVNFLPVKFYGEIEFWFALLKVIVVIMLIITMLVIDVGGGPSGDYIGGRYWRDPGPMAQLFWEPDPATNVPMGGIMGSWGRFLAFWNVFVSAAFAFAGTEIVGVTVGEVENPRKNVPKAIKRVAIRIIVFYVLAVLMVGLVVAYNDPLLLNGDSSNASASPYVIAIQNAGIKGYPHFINAVLLTVTWSAGQSDCYAASRTIYGLALEGRAPHFLTKCTKGGVPIWAVFITALYAPLAYMAVGAVGAAQTFTYLYDISAVSILLVWWAIMITYLRFHHGMKVQGLPRSILPYQAPLQPYLSWFALIFFTLVILLSAFTVFINGHWAVDTFVTDYISIPLFAIVWLGYKLVTKSKTVSYATMDFHTGRRQLEALDEAALAKPEPQGVFAKILDVLL